jgi:DNA uptake protein ComE-like DNA-binding protein
MSKFRIIAATAALAILTGAGLAAVRPDVAEAAAAQVQARLNANTATEAQLRAVAGLPAPTVAAILRARPFASTAAFHTVAGAGLSADQRASVYSRVFVPIKLNAATREEIMLIPGMTARMAHEFEEYRPYRDLAQFDREIGKYVDAAEVARLRSYVALN